MTKLKDIVVPDIGDFTGVEVIEILVSPGDSIQAEDPLVTLESDKATMDIPSPHAGTVAEIIVSVGDKVSEGNLLIKMKVTDPARETGPVGELSGPEVVVDQPEQTNTVAIPVPSGSDIHTEVAVLGAGPGGYSAAFRAADLGKKTVLIERYPTLGGVCLNVGCIPSKALLHVARVIEEIEDLKKCGIDLGGAIPDKKPVRAWTEGVIKKLTDGLQHLARQRKVEVIHGTGKFTSTHTIEVMGESGVTIVSFDHAIIAAGSESIMIPGLPVNDPRVLDSTSALLLEQIPERLLIIGGGIIGLEMATVYAALGSRITVVEMLDSLIADCDKDIVRVLEKRIKSRYENIYLKSSVTGVKAKKEFLTVSFNGGNAPETDRFDAVLVAVGRRPNGMTIDAELAGVKVNDHGFIEVDDQLRTNVDHIHAIGDITGQPMLAHKATHEGKVAAEVISGLKSAFNQRVIPSVAYTDPEIAWVGVTESIAKEKGIDYGKGVFPWAASGRSLSLGRDEGMTKLIFEKDSHRIIGAAIVGPNAGDLIAECALAIEMGADAEDIGLTIHPHPTLSETIGMAAEAFEGIITDLYIPKK